MAAVFKENPMRTAAYAAAFIILAIVYVARIGSFATLGEATYALSIIIAVAIALAAGALAFQRFRAEQRDAFLLISAGLWVTAALHLYHFAAYTGFFGAADSTLTAASVLRGALLPTLFFSLFLGLSLLASRQDRPSTAQSGGIYFAAATLAFIVTVASLVFPFPPSNDVVWVLGQPFVPLAAQPELLLAAALTLVGMAAVLRSGRWRTEPFARWLLFAFIVTIIALARFPLLNAWQLEELLLLAQGLTLASYLCVIAGIYWKATGRATATAGVAEAVRPVAAEASLAPGTADEKPATAPALALRDLQASHRALRNATEGLLVGMRSDGTITDWKAAADFGPSAMPSDLLGKNIQAVLPSDQSAAVMAAVGRVLQAGKTERLHYAATDGSVILEGYVTAHTADQALCIIRDNTAHAHTLQELDVQRRAADSLRRVTGDWLIRMTRGGTIQDLKPPSATQLAAYETMFAGKHLQDVFQGDDVTPLVAAAESALESGAVQELSFLRQSGQVLAVRVATYAKDTVLCLLRDATELKEAMAQLQESEETNQALRTHLEQLNSEQATALTNAEASVRVLRTLLPDLVLRVRADGTILECKPAESFGPQDAESMVGARAREALSVDLASQMMAAIERVQSDGQPQRFTCHPVGGQVLAGGIAALVDDQFLCVVRDLTQQKQMETALAQQAAILAQEMQAKLEAESLRALRSENDVLRQHLLRVAQLALEGRAGAGPANAPSDASSDPGGAGISGEVRGVAQPAATESSQADPPPQPQQAADTPPPAAAQAASEQASTPPDESREIDTLANGEPPRHGAEAGTDGSPRGSADGPTTEAATQGNTAVATRQAVRQTPTLTENGQEEPDARTNGEPTEDVRPT